MQIILKAGEVLVDGISMAKWETESLHAQMVLVAQSPLLFDTSVRNNLTYGCRRTVTDAELEEAATMANCHNFVVDFPAGYDTYVGDQGIPTRYQLAITRIRNWL